MQLRKQKSKIETKEGIYTEYLINHPITGWKYHNETSNNHKCNPKTVGFKDLYGSKSNTTFGKTTLK